MHCADLVREPSGDRLATLILSLHCKMQVSRQTPLTRRVNSRINSHRVRQRCYVFISRTPGEWEETGTARRRYSRQLTSIAWPRRCLIARHSTQRLQRGADKTPDAFGHKDDEFRAIHGRRHCKSAVLRLRYHKRPPEVTKQQRKPR